MQTLQLTRIGTLAATHGLDGSIVMMHSLLGNKKALNSIKTIFIELRKESYIPYFITGQKNMGDNQLLLQLEDIHNVEAAKALAGKACYIEAEELERRQLATYHASLKGYAIVDVSLGRIGIIDELFETPGQVLAAVMYNGREVLIPVIDATLQRIDHHTKEIILQIPEGLLGVY